MSITQYILGKTNRLSVKPEISPGDHGFSMFNDAGTEVEISEFLYGLVRMLKPNLILETGTHKGISSAFMGQSLKDNNKGKIITTEIHQEHIDDAKALWKDIGVDDYIISHKQESLRLNFDSDVHFDMLFLDSEPQLRFDEFIRFWPNVIPGGFILIHDLHSSMGHHDKIYHDVYDWPYGDFRIKLGPFIKNLDITWIHFKTPRGLSMFQKSSSEFFATKFALGKEL